MSDTATWIQRLLSVMEDDLQVIEDEYGNKAADERRRLIAAGQDFLASMKSLTPLGDEEFAFTIRAWKSGGKVTVQLNGDAVDWSEAVDAKAMLDLLRMLEWSRRADHAGMGYGPSEPSCPNCGYRTWQHEHDPGCELGALLDKHGRLR